MTNTAIYRAPTCRISRRSLVAIMIGSASLAALLISPHRHNFLGAGR
jgi:hypothetical protein